MKKIIAYLLTLATLFSIGSMCFAEEIETTITETSAPKGDLEIPENSQDKVPSEILEIIKDENSLKEKSVFSKIWDFIKRNSVGIIGTSIVALTAICLYPEEVLRCIIVPPIVNISNWYLMLTDIIKQAH